MQQPQHRAIGWLVLGSGAQAEARHHISVTTVFSVCLSCSCCTSNSGSGLLLSSRHVHILSAYWGSVESLHLDKVLMSKYFRTENSFCSTNKTRHDNSPSVLFPLCATTVCLLLGWMASACPCKYFSQFFSFCTVLGAMSREWHFASLLQEDARHIGVQEG